MGTRWRVAAMGGVVAVAVFGPAAVAAADVTTPPGVCVGSGTWQSTGKTEKSTEHVSSDVITVPRADTVHWTGSEKGFALGATGPRRDISGAVQLELPPPIGTVDIDTWGGSSVRYANEGEHKYDLPAVLAGVKGKVKGFHKENGQLTCEGSVFVQIDGSATSNPLFYASLAGIAVSGAMLFFAGKAVFTKAAPAFEDINPG